MSVGKREYEIYSKRERTCQKEKAHLEHARDNGSGAVPL